MLFRSELLMTAVCPVRVSGMGRPGELRGFFDEIDVLDDWMMGFWLIEMYPDLASMNIFSSSAGGYSIMDTVCPSGDGSLRGRPSHGASSSVALPLTVHLDSYGLLSSPLVTRCSQQWASPVFLVSDLRLVARPEAF